MKVLLSWSGRQSRRVAEVLNDWLPEVLPTLTPWMSTEDIDKGKRWSEELQDSLTAADACVVCLTPENISSPWLYWETGAIALVQKHPICPLLINVTPDDIKNTPLVQFQCTFDREDDVLNLLRSLNRRLGGPEDEMRLKGIFATYWKELHDAFKEVADMGTPKNVLALLNGLEDLRRTFGRRWSKDKLASSWDPIRELLKTTTYTIEKLTAEPGIERRAILHCDELKRHVNAILSASTREQIFERGDNISTRFDSAIAAIRADYDTES